MNYPPTPQRKSCNCEDPCISTDDIYYAGPNLPNSGVNTSDLLTEVIEKLDAIYAVPTLQKVTEMGNVTTLPIIADSFVKIGGSGSNVLLDNGTTIPISGIGGSQNLQQVTDLGATTTNTISVFVNTSGDNGINSYTLDGYSFYASSISGSGVYAESISGGALIAQSENGYGISCFSGGSLGLFAGSNQGVGASISCDSGKGIEVYGNGTIAIEANLGNSNDGLVINSGASSSGKPIVIDKNGVEKLVVNQEGELSIVKIPGGNEFEYLMADGSITTAIPFNPSDYDLDEFTNNNIDPFAHISDIPAPVATALVFLDEGNGNGIARSDSFRNPINFGNIGLDAFDISWSDTAGNYGATGASSFAVGDLLTAQGYGSFLIGGGNTSSVDSVYTFQSGFNHTETGIGYANFFTGAGHSITGGAYATIVGQFANVVTNNPNDVNDGNNTMFAIGNGTAQGDGTLQSRSTALQVYQNGRVIAPSLTTALINADTTGKIVATKEYVDSKRPYKVYTALLNQTGTSDPIPTVLENTIGGTFTYSYDGVGIYSFTVTGIAAPFTLNKTAVFISGQPYGIGFGTVTTATVLTTQDGSILTQQGSGGVNSYLVNTAIEIRVYN